MKGPVVRLAPDTIDVTSPEIASEAWGGHNETKLPWNKDPEFCRMVRGGLRMDNILSASGAKEALRMRRFMGSPFAKKFLFDQEYIFKRSTKKMIENLELNRRSNNGKVEVTGLFMKYSFDVLSMCSFELEQG
jgi:hypothetical protein